MLTRVHGWESRRHLASLVDRFRTAGDRQLVKSSKEKPAFQSQDVLDSNGEPFREFFVMPKRKLNAQLQLERATGRAEREKLSRVDINDRLAVRKPRAKEMDPSQDWPSVWPAARSFASSVVPLPIRMGSRPHPERRAPFKKEGNLELVKIPNFLHLTPAAIQRHCEALKQFCTEYPKELKENPQLAEEEFPITISVDDYVHQGTNIRDFRARIVTLTIKSAALGLDEHAKNKFMRLAGSRYKEATDTLTIITDRCHTRKQNLDYAYYLLTALYHESRKVEEWEKLMQREDHIKVLFEGSSTESRLVDTISKILKDDEAATPLKNDLSADADQEKILEHPAVRDFADMWYNYRNQKETEQSAEEYGERVRQLLGLPSLQSQEKNAQ